MSMVLQVLKILEIYIFLILEFFLLPKINSTHSKQLKESSVDGKINKLYINITDKSYPLVNIGRKWDIH